MPHWKPERYLQFASERAVPCRDLISRLPKSQPASIVDIGCGPGNSTAALQARFPTAAILGIDPSPHMLQAAQALLPGIAFRQAAIESWSPDQTFDCLFSNAALQWAPDHATLFPRLGKMLRPGGVFAVQMPYPDDASPINVTIRTITTSARWRRVFSAPVRSWGVEHPAFYYDLLCRDAQKIDIWRTDYYHPLESADAVIDWYCGTGLQPYIEALASAEDRSAFLTDCRQCIRPLYRIGADGRVLFCIPRLFIVYIRNE